VVGWPEAALVAAWLAVAVLVGSQLRDLDRASFAVRNDTPWDIGVVLQTDHASLPLTTVGHEHSKELTEVAVPGSTWTFVWRFDGRDLGRTTVSDENLRRAGFELRVPADVEAALRAAGTAPSP